MRARLKVFFDGGCRPGPGPMELAVVAAGRATIVPDAGYGTSADAEWLALIHALGVAQVLGVGDFVLLGDAADIVAKANGTLNYRPAERHHFAAFQTLAAGQKPRVRWIKRSQNLAGIALAARHVR